MVLSSWYSCTRIYKQSSSWYIHAETEIRTELLKEWRNIIKSKSVRASFLRQKSISHCKQVIELTDCVFRAIFIAHVELKLRQGRHRVWAEHRHKAMLYDRVMFQVILNELAWQWLALSDYQWACYHSCCSEARTSRLFQRQHIQIMLKSLHVE